MSKSSCTKTTCRKLSKSSSKRSFLQKWPKLWICISDSTMQPCFVSWNRGLLHSKKLILRKPSKLKMTWLTSKMIKTISKTSERLDMPTWLSNKTKLFTQYSSCLRIRKRPWNTMVRRWRSQELSNQPIFCGKTLGLPRNRGELDGVQVSPAFWFQEFCISYSQPLPSKPWS